MKAIAFLACLLLSSAMAYAKGFKGGSHSHPDNHAHHHHHHRQTYHPVRTSSPRQNFPCVDGTVSHDRHNPCMHHGGLRGH